MRMHRLIHRLLIIEELEPRVAPAGLWTELGGSASGNGISNTPGRSENPSIAIMGDGTPMVVWADSSTGWDIYASRWDGATWSAPDNISNNPGYSLNVDVAVGSNGNPVAVWTDDSDGDFDIYVSRWTGTAWGPVETVAENSNVFTCPVIAVDNNNNPVVAWDDDSSGTYQTYCSRWNGTAWATAENISVTGGNSRHPSLAADHSGNTFVSWEDNTSGHFEIYLRQWDGSAWGATQNVSNNGGYSIHSSIAVQDNGNPIVAWMDQGTGQDDIYISWWDGIAWTAAENVSNNTGSSTDPSIVIGDDGNPIVAWADDTGGSPEIYVRRWTGAGWNEFGMGSATGGGISANTLNSSRAFVAIDGDGNPLVAWDQDLDGMGEPEDQIYLRKYVSVPMTIYVDANVVGGANDGTGWDNAFADLQQALALAESGDEIWVADGTYYATANTDRTVSFQLKSGVAVFGGFEGTESLLQERDWAQHETILSGDIGALGDNSDNSYHVLVGANNATISGFTITGGNADGGLYTGYDVGGGMFNEGVSPTVSDCIFVLNTADYHGGGMYNGAWAAPLVSNCVFRNNTSTLQHGGGMSNLSASPTITDSVFADNSAGSQPGVWGWGGAISSLYDSTITVTNTAFVGNTTTVDGGAVFINGGASVTLINCTLTGNNAVSYGGAIATTKAADSITLTNCILWGNTGGSGNEIGNRKGTVTISHTNIEGGWNGPDVFNTDGGVTLDDGGNINADPFFVDASDPDGADDTFLTGDDGLRLQPGSPSMNMASDNDAPAADILGVPRFIGNAADLGAYEYEAVCLDVGGATTYTFTDADGDDVQVALGGSTGTVWLWDAFGNAPNVTDIATVQFAESNASTTLTIEVIAPGGGGWTSGGDLTDGDATLAVGTIQVEGVIGDVSLGNVASMLETLVSPTAGNIGSVTLNDGDFNGTIQAANGSIGGVSIIGDLNGGISADADFGNLTVGGAIAGTATLSVGRDLTGSVTVNGVSGIGIPLIISRDLLGSITITLGGIAGNVGVGRNLTGTLKVAGTMGDLNVGERLSGTVSVSDLGSITVGGNVYEAAVNVTGGDLAVLSVAGVTGIVDSAFFASGGIGVISFSSGGLRSSSITTPGNIGPINIARDMRGTITSTGGDFTDPIQIGGDMAGTLAATRPDSPYGSFLGVIRIGGVYTGSIQATGSIAGIEVGGDNTTFVDVRHVTNDTTDSSPAIYEDSLVWSGQTTEGDWEIFYYDGANQTVQLTNNTVDDLLPSIHTSSFGTMVSWVNDLGEIFVWDEVNGTRQINDAASLVLGPDDFARGSLYDGQVGWTSNNTIYLWDGVSATSIASTTDENRNVHLSDGGAMAWDGRVTGFDWDVMYYDGAVITDITSGDGVDQHVDDIYGDQILWEASDGSDMELYVYDVSDAGMTWWTDNEYDDVDGAMYEGDVVWMYTDPVGGDWDVMYYDATTGGETSLTQPEEDIYGDSDDFSPDLYGDEATYSGYDGTPAPEIWSADLDQDGAYAGDDFSGEVDAGYDVDNPDAGIGYVDVGGDVSSEAGIYADGSIGDVTVDGSVLTDGVDHAVIYASDSIAAVTVEGDFRGELVAESGTIDSVSIGGVFGSAIRAGGRVNGAITIGGEVLGGEIQAGEFGGEIQIEGNVAAVAMIEADAGKITSVYIGGSALTDGVNKAHITALTDIDSIYVVGDFRGEATAVTGNIGTFYVGGEFGSALTAGGAITGDLTILGDMIGGTITAGGAIEGAMDVEGTVWGHLKAANFSYIHIGAALGDLGHFETPGIIESLNAIDELVVYGEIRGTIIAPGGIGNYTQSGMPQATFMDADGDTAAVRLTGPGGAFFFDASEGGEMWIKLVDTTDRSQLLVRQLDSEAGDGVISLGTISTPTGQSMGSVRIFATGGGVTNTTISVGGNLGMLFLRGNADNLDVAVGGDLAKQIVVGNLTDCDIGVGGSVLISKTVGNVTGGSLSIGGEMRTLIIKGDVIDTSFHIMGDLGIGKLIGASNGMTLDVDGKARLAMFVGPVTESGIDIGGDTFLLKAAIGLDGTDVSIGGDLCKAILLGGLTNSTLTVAGKADLVKSIGGQASSTLDLAGGLDTALLFGGMDHAAVSVTGPVRRCLVTGAMQNASSVHIAGDTSFFSIKDGVIDSTVTIDGRATTVLLCGPPMGDSAWMAHRRSRWVAWSKCFLRRATWPAQWTLSGRPPLTEEIPT